MRIVTYPDPILLSAAEPVGAIDEEVAARAQRMFEVLAEAKGLGLAAPQVGWSARLFIVHLPGDEELGRPEFRQVFVNPAILDKKGRSVAEEGCLSIPGVFGPVGRAASVTLEATDLSGEHFEMEADGLLARVLQHESDHLDGVLFVSKVVPSAQKQIMRRLKEFREKAASAGRA